MSEFPNFIAKSIVHDSVLIQHQLGQLILYVDNRWLLCLYWRHPGDHCHLPLIRWWWRLVATHSTETGPTISPKP